jgi:hypothetical protein
MAEYHVGCGLSAIYAGTILKPGLWKNKTQVTDEAVSAVAQWLLMNGVTFKFTMNGKKYRMEVNEDKDENKFKE